MDGDSDPASAHVGHISLAPKAGDSPSGMPSGSPHFLELEVSSMSQGLSTTVYTSVI
ncbi:hypothetical protein TRAPUB_12317 [Trametes pubescens]|uniref:Uncharacterized protein n=1 Tax=Trametes pubescens TaxID=154538 RepID=A0A1M2VU67_TRAPU|nr:hypothetical protein TRAPUB_12317 [Trametes pubescens]